MNRVNFNELKNIKAPESLINSALNVPKQEKKKLFLLRYYQYSIGFAAAILVAVGVSMFLFFGSGSNSRVNFPSLSPQTTTQAEFSADSTGREDASALQAPSTEKEKTEAVTEPAETDVINDTESSKINQQSTTAAADGTKPQAQNETERNIGETVQEPTESEKTEPVTDEPQENITTQPMTNGGGEASVDVYFSTEANSATAQGRVYCRLEDENGNIVGDEGLYHNKRRALKYSLSDETVRLTLIAYLKLENGKTYTVIFYNSQGEVIKQGAVAINGSAEYYI